MLKKEFYDALRKLFECLLILLVVPLALLYSDYSTHFDWNFYDVFNPAFLVVTILFSVYSGMTIFQSERRDNAVEYLLSLPLPRWKIIMYKITTRVLFLILLLSILVFLSVFKNTFYACFNLVLLFSLALFLSISVNSAFIGSLGTGLLYLFYYSNSRIIGFLATKTDTFAAIPDNYLFHRLISALLIVIPLGIAFWITFKNLDVKPLKLQLKPYIKIFLPALFILISFVFLIAKKYIARFSGM